MYNYWSVNIEAAFPCSIYMKFTLDSVRSKTYNNKVRCVVCINLIFVPEQTGLKEPGTETENSCQNTQPEDQFTVVTI